MVRARLHVICGNCGCSDEWQLRIERDGDDVTDTDPAFEDAVSMVCGNCSTIHNLKDNAKTVRYDTNTQGTEPSDDERTTQDREKLREQGFFGKPPPGFSSWSDYWYHDSFRGDRYDKQK